MVRRCESTKLRILAAAREVFSSVGYHGARVDVIAEHSGVNKQRLYAYFSSKDGLFAAVMQQAFEEIAQAEAEMFARIEQSDEPLTQAVLSEYMRFHREHSHFWRLLAWENLEGGAHAQAFGALRAEAFRTFRVLFESRRAAGELPRESSFEAFVLLVSAIPFFFHANAVTLSQTLGLDLKDEQVAARMLRELASLLAGQEPRHGVAAGDPPDGRRSGKAPRR